LDQKCSVADPGCLSRILIFTFPGSRIQKQKQKRGVKKFVVIPFFVATNFTKLKIILFLKLFNQKFVTELSKIWVWDPRSGIWDQEKPISNRGSGSRGQKGSRSRIRNTARVIMFLGKRKGSNRK
jgi:hypothetical protein